MRIEFSIPQKELHQAVKRILAASPERGGDGLEYVDLNASDEDVTLTLTGQSESIPADVRKPGNARLPYSIFRSIERMFKSLPNGPVPLRITDGEIRVGTSSVKSPEIAERVTGERKIDLPVNPSFSEVLNLAFQYTSDELEDSGLLPRVAEAQKRVSDLIERASAVLDPLGIESSAVGDFVWKQLKDTARK